MFYSKIGKIMEKSGRLSYKKKYMINFKKLGVILLCSTVIINSCATKDEQTSSNVKKKSKQFL